MHTRLWTLSALAVAITAAALWLLLPGTRPTAVPVPRVAVSVPAAAPGTDWRDKHAVCGAFASALYGRDTVADIGPGDANIRAGAYADAAYAEALTLTVPGRLPGWAEWAAHQAVIKVETGRVGGDVEDDQSATIAVTHTAHGRDGWTGPPQRALVHCRLSIVNGEWRVSGYGIEPR